MAPDGTTQLKVDFPVSQHIDNIGSHVDGFGMCVMSSVEMAGLWANLEQMRGLRDWCAKQPGGGWPEKVDKQLKEFCGTHNMNTPGYIQYEGTDTTVLRMSLDTGRFPAVTYSGNDKVRYPRSIAHMVCLAHLDDNWACVWDNNGKRGELIWMTPNEFFERWQGPEKSGWAFVWLAPPPPPVPHN